jgi:RHS repeat-associated protein
VRSNLSFLDARYTGKERDAESGLDYFGARYYGSSMCRWLSPDVINLTSARLMNPANTLNKYVYGGNNPLKYIDKDGQDITVFYRPPSGADNDYGHTMLGALNQATGRVAFLDYYPGPNGADDLGIAEAVTRILAETIWLRWDAGCRMPQSLP